MAYALDPAELHRRWQAAAAVSVRRTERAVELVAAAEVHRDQAKRVRDLSRRRRADTPARSLVGFRIDGTVDDEPCMATFVDGALTCSPALRDRAEIVVALGETFTDGAGRWIAASLDRPVIAVLVTLMRAFSRISSIEMSTSSGVR